MPASRDAARDDVVRHDSDGSYLHWIALHPHGYVLNTYRSPEHGPLVLHLASCPHLRGPNEPGAFTRRRSRKVCAESKAALFAWAAGVGRPGDAVTACNTCAP